MILYLKNTYIKFIKKNYACIIQKFCINRGLCVAFGKFYNPIRVGRTRATLHVPARALY